MTTVTIIDAGANRTDISLEQAKQMLDEVSKKKRSIYNDDTIDYFEQLLKGEEVFFEGWYDFWLTDKLLESDKECMQNYFNI